MRLAAKTFTAAFLALGAPAAADENPVATPEIIIVGATPQSSVGASATQVPANVQTGTAKEIKDEGPSNLADFLNSKIGSVSVSNGTGNSYQSDVSYRGFQATSLLGAPVGLTVYVDGVRNNEAFGSTINWDQIPMNAISSIVLIPGSNPLFGLNTLGGALAIRTKNGLENSGLSLTQAGGSWGRTATSVEAGMANGNWDYFLALNYDRQDGYRRYSSSDVRQLFGKVRWHSEDEKHQIELSLSAADNFLNGTQALPLSMLGDIRQAYTWPDNIKNKMATGNLKVSSKLSEANLISGGIYFRHQDSRSLNSNAALDDGCGATKCTNSAPGGTAPNGVTATNNQFNLQRYTGDINTSNVYATTVQNTVGASAQVTNSQELWGQKNALTAGGAWDHARIGYGQNTLLARLINYETVTTPNLRYYFPSTAGATGSNILSAVNLHAETNNFSLFASDNLDITDEVSLTVSASYNAALISQHGSSSQFLNEDGGFNWTDSVTGNSYYNLSFIGSQFYSGNTLRTATIPANSIAGPEIASLEGTHRYTRFNPAIGLTYNPSPNLGFFSGYSESMRAPTPIELSCADPNSPCSLPTGFNGDPDLKAVVARTGEVGARGKLLDRLLSWNLSLYDTVTSNDIEFMYATPTSGFFNNVGKTRRRGAEIGIEGNFDRLSLKANYGFVDATFLSSFRIGSSANSSANDTGAILVTKGDKIPGIAEQALKLRAAYNILPNWVVAGNLMFIGGQYAHGDENNKDRNGRIPGYAVLNLDTHYDVSNQWRLFAQVHNALNSKYATYGTLGQNVYSNRPEQFKTPAAPVAVWVGVIFTVGGQKSIGNFRFDQD